MNTVYYILIIILFVYIINQFIEIEDYFEFKRSHPYNFPLVSIEDNFLSPNECENLKKYILNHELLKHNWDNSYVIRFNTNENSKKMFLHHNLGTIYKIFENIKQPGTNAYIVNTAILDNSNNKTGKHNDIKFHCDDTIEIKDFMGRFIMPVCTTVLYISIPENYTGGNLILKPFASKNNEKVYKPKQGRKLTFRGDMNHCVEPFFCDYTTKRISLVFEQYKIPDKYIHKTEFDFFKR
jgi:hypothetical protein